MTALSTPNLRSEANRSVKSAALIGAEDKIKHYKSLLRITAGKLEEAVQRANDASTRATSAEASAADALVKVAGAEAAYQLSEGKRLHADQELERRRAMLEEREVELRRARRDIGKLQAENQALKRSLEAVQESKDYYTHAFRDLQAEQDGGERIHILDMRRNFIEGREEGWSDGRWEGYDEGFKQGRKQGYKEGKEAGKREEGERALAALERYFDRMASDSRK